MNILAALKNLPDPTENERALICYILDQPQDVVQMNPKTLADSAHVSLSSLYRLFEKLDLSGMKELKVALAASLHEQPLPEVDAAAPITKNENHYQTFQALKNTYEVSAAGVMDLLDVSQLQQIVRAMRKAEQIVVFTSAANLYMAQNFSYQMQEIHIRVAVPVSDYQIRMEAAQMTSRDLAIVISYEGLGDPLRKIVPFLSSQHVPILLIGGMHKNALKSYADYHIWMPKIDGQNHKISAFSTRFSILFILDALYSMVFKMHYEKNADYKQEIFRKIDSFTPGLLEPDDQTPSKKP